MSDPLYYNGSIMIEPDEASKPPAGVGVMSPADATRMFEKQREKEDQERREAVADMLTALMGRIEDACCAGETTAYVSSRDPRRLDMVREALKTAGWDYPYMRVCGDTITLVWPKQADRHV